MLSFQIVSHVGYIVMGLGLLVALESAGGMQSVVGFEAVTAAAVSGGEAAATEVPAGSGAVLAAGPESGDDPSAVVQGAVLLALTGAVLYVIHEIVVVTNLFLLAGWIERLRGTGMLAPPRRPVALRPGDQPAVPGVGPRPLRRAAALGPSGASSPW